MSRVRIATYNIHSGVGIDRRFLPSRTVEVIGELDADVVALQEVASPVGAFDVHELLRAKTGFHLDALTTMRLAGGAFGNVLLSRWPIRESTRHVLTVGSREPRGALDVIVGRTGAELRVIVTHLGLRSAERREQMTRLFDIVRNGASIPTVLIGDFNVIRRREWHAFDGYFGRSDAPPTFPSIAPVFALDRIFAKPGTIVSAVAAHRSRRAPFASDHLPLVATLELPSGA